MTNRITQSTLTLIVSFIVVFGLMGLAQGQVTEHRTTDGEIEGAIVHRLGMDSRVEAKAIGVTVENGHAVLFGQVDSLEERGLAAKVAMSVQGVQSLTNKLEVPPDMGKDEEITQSIKQKLHHAQLLQDNTIHVRVNRQEVILDGTVMNHKDKRTARRLVEGTKGVRDVKDLLKVAEEPREDQEIYKDVIHYLTWSSLFNDKDIEVRVTDGTVTLEGTIDTLVQRDVLKIDIGNIHGVDEVDAGRVIPADLVGPTAGRGEKG